MIARSLVLLFLVLSLSACAGTSDKAVRQAIRNHPEIVFDALAQHKLELFALALQGQQEYQLTQRQSRQAQETQKPLSPVIDPARLIRGKASAPVTVVVYSDFLCPYCARGAATLKEFLERHPDTVKVLYKHYALDPVSRRAALVYEALAREDPKLAFAFYDAAFADQQELSTAGEPAVLALAIKLGANPRRLARDLRRPELAKRIDADVAEARAFGIDGTPTFLLNGVSIHGAASLAEFGEILRKVAPADNEAPCPTCDKTKK